MFRLANVAGRSALIDETHWFDLAGLAADPTLADPLAALAAHRWLPALQAQTASTVPDGLLSETVLGPCVPVPRKVFAVGLNYRSHALESNLDIPESPVVFTKFPSCLVGPTADIELCGTKVDWEVELVVVIGERGRHIDTDAAWAHVAGLTVGQDISDRQVQRTGNPAQFSMGKSFDTYGPLGPAVVSIDSIADPDDIALRCDISGETMQEARTADMIFSVPELIAYLSSICTLEPGDLIFTGTPGGVGAGRDRYLHAGDVIDTSAEGIGAMRNVCVVPTTE